MSSMGDASSAGDLFSAGESGVGSNSFGFSLGDLGSSGSDSGGGLAGLTGIGSGMFDTSGSGSSGFSSLTAPDTSGFTMPGAGGGLSLGNASSALGMGSKLAGSSGGSSQTVQGGRGMGARMPTAKSFVVPVSSAVLQPGTVNGNSLISLMQRLRVGSTS